jgi:hypothetical protein
LQTKCYQIRLRYRRIAVSKADPSSSYCIISQSSAGGEHYALDAALFVTRLPIGPEVWNGARGEQFSKRTSPYRGEVEVADFFTNASLE